MITAEQAWDVYRRAECLYTRAQIDDAIDEMADKIAAVMKDKDPVVIAVMNGGLIPSGLLLPKLDFPLQVDYLHATRYKNNVGGELRWTVKPQNSLQGRTVLIVDDILDEGMTLQYILDFCQQQGAAELFSCVLVEKKHQRKNGCKHADFVGLQVEDVYVFGAGMDYKGYLRNLPGIYAIDE